MVLVPRRAQIPSGKRMSMNLVTGPSPVHRPWLQAQRLAPRPSRRIRLAAVLAIAAATPLALPSTAADAADCLDDPSEASGCRLA